MAKRSISVVFQAFTSKFNKKTKGASKSISVFAATAAKAASVFLVIKKAIDTVSASLDRMDKKAKKASQLKVSPEFLTALEESSMDAGAAFGVATQGLEKFAKTIGEAQQGFGTGKKGLEELGLTLEDLGGKNFEGMYLQIADAIGKIEDPTRQAALATQFFGEKGKELINSFKGARDAVAAAKEEAKELGLVISGEQLQAVEKFNDSVARIQRKFGKIIDKIVVELVPALQEVADFIEKNLSGAIKAFAKEWNELQKSVENFLTFEVFGGKGIDVRFTDETKENAAIDLKTPAAKEKKAKKIREPREQAIKTFTEAAQAQGSRAFDLLNPAKTVEIQAEQLAELKGINEGVAKIAANSSSANHVQVSI